MTTDVTPVRRRLDGQRTAHLCYTLELDGGRVWVPLCRAWAARAGTTWSAEGCALCPECGELYHGRTYAARKETT